MGDLYDKEHIARVFDAYGDQEWNRHESSPMARVSFHIHLHYLRQFVRQGDLVLEVGAGAGRFTVELARLGARVTATDISGVQLDLNRMHVTEAGLEDQIEAWAEADVVDLVDFADGSFDVTSCFGGPLSYAMDRVDDAVHELLRVTKPGGLVLVSVMSNMGTLRAYLGSLATGLRDGRRYSRPETSLPSSRVRAGCTCTGGPSCGICSSATGQTWSQPRRRTSCRQVPAIFPRLGSPTPRDGSNSSIGRSPQARSPVRLTAGRTSSRSYGGAPRGFRLCSETCKNVHAPRRARPAPHTICVPASMHVSCVCDSDVAARWPRIRQMVASLDPGRDHWLGSAAPCDGHRLRPRPLCRRSVAWLHQRDRGSSGVPGRSRRISRSVRQPTARRTPITGTKCPRAPACAASTRRDSGE